MMRFLLQANLIFATLFLINFAPLQAADEEERAPEDIKEVQQGNYPSFVGQEREGQEDESPEEQPGEEAREVPEDEPPQEPQDVLVTDLSSTTTWVSTRERIEPAVENLRMQILSEAEPQLISEQVEQISRDLEIIARMSSYQASNQQRGLRYFAKRLRRLLEFIETDYQQERLRKLETTEGLLTENLDSFQQLLMESDLERGREVPDYWKLPEDWDVGNFRVPPFSDEIAGWDGKRLLDAYRRRQNTLAAEIKNDADQWNLLYPREMAALARELATRTHEVPVTSRKTFQSAALRLDVLAENLHDYMREGNYLYAKRHLRVIGKAIKDCEAFLELRERGF